MYLSLCLVPDILYLLFSVGNSFSHLPVHMHSFLWCHYFVVLKLLFYLLVPNYFFTHERATLR